MLTNRNVLTNLLPGLLRVLGDVIPTVPDSETGDDYGSTRTPASRAVARDAEDEENDDEDQQGSDAEASERTPLVSTSRLRSSRAISPVIKTWRILTSSPNIAAAALGLLVGLVKPIQRALIGTHHEAGTWQSLGTGLILLGGAYAAVEVFAVGASLRAAERKL